MREYETYTGNLIYKEIEFTFVYDKNKLKLIPPKEKIEEVGFWFMKEIGKSVYTLGDPIYVEENLIGRSNETRHNIIFIPSHRNISHINSNLIIDIEYYIINKYDRETIDRISIKGPEITHIFPTTIALNKIDWKENGEIGVSTKTFEETTTKKEKFGIDDKEILIYFGISISSSYKTGEVPISLYSTLFLEFEPTNDYMFIIKIINICKQFIQYLCYRKNIVFSSIELAAPTSKGLHESCAQLYKVKEDVVEEYPIEKGRYIKYDYIKGSIGKIINDIVIGNIYLKHLPETYELGLHINAGSFVMITAGFEWEFKRNYPEGIKKDKKTIEAELNVNNLIDGLIENNKGKSKEILKYLKKSIEFKNLQSKIIEYGNDYCEISDIFGKQLYQLNGKELNYKDMGKRISDQRNNFAHGNLDKEFIGLSLLDLIYLQFIIYIMQLKFYEIEDEKIKKCINELFARNLSL